MSKTVHDDVLDAALNYVKSNATRICVCSAQPTTYNEAITTYKLAIKTIASTDFTGPADGDTSGRKLTVNQEATITVDAPGTALFIALCDSVNSKLLYVTTCTSQAILAGDIITIPLWKMEIADPT
ncbi:MAG: hypothetical protein WC347_01060 [Smithellaceae bacterium]|jgi:hypothetical protein